MKPGNAESIPAFICVNRLKHLVIGWFNHMRHISIALCDQALVSGVNFITGIVLARFWGIEKFGVYSLVWMSILLINNFQSTMILSPMMSIGPKLDKSDLPRYLGVIAGQQALYSLLSFAVLFSGVKASGLFFPQWHIQDIALSLAVVSVSFQVGELLRLYFFSFNRESTAFFYDSVRYGGRLIALVILFLNVKTVTMSHVFWLISGTSFVALIVGVFFVGPLRWPGMNYFRALSIRHWHFSKWLIASAVMLWTSGNLFTIAGATYLGAGIVGILKATHNILGVTHIFDQGLSNVVPVKAAQKFNEEGIGALSLYLQKIAFLGTVVLGCIAFCFLLFPKFILGLVYGDVYRDYGLVLQWYSLLYMFSIVDMPVTSGLRALEYTKPSFWARAAVTVYAFVFAVPLARNWGLFGILIGSLCSHILFSGVITVAYIHRSRTMRD